MLTKYIHEKVHPDAGTEISKVTESTQQVGSTVSSSIASRSVNPYCTPEQWDEVKESTLTKRVTTKLWHKAKFVFDKTDLEYGNAILNIILKEMKVHPSNKKLYWEWAKQKTQKNLNKKRNAVISAIKKWLVGK